MPIKVEGIYFLAYLYIYINSISFYYVNILTRHLIVLNNFQESCNIYFYLVTPTRCKPPG